MLVAALLLLFAYPDALGDTLPLGARAPFRGSTLRESEHCLLCRHSALLAGPDQGRAFHAERVGARYTLGMAVMLHLAPDVHERC